VVVVFLSTPKPRWFGSANDSPYGLERVGVTARISAGECGWPRAAHRHGQRNSLSASRLVSSRRSAGIRNRDSARARHASLSAVPEVRTYSWTGGVVAALAITEAPSSTAADAICKERDRRNRRRAHRRRGPGATWEYRQRSADPRRGGHTVLPGISIARPGTYRARDMRSTCLTRDLQRACARPRC